MRQGYLGETNEYRVLKKKVKERYMKGKCTKQESGKTARSHSSSSLLLSIKNCSGVYIPVLRAESLMLPKRNPGHPRLCSR